MTFVLICIGALVLLGGVAALLSRGDDTPIQQGHDCSTCLSRDDGSCKIKCLLDDLKEKGDPPKSSLSREDLQSHEKSDRKRNKNSLPMQGGLGWVVIILLLCSCSTEKNTSQSRWWHSFTARYNTYYNGNLAYIDASLEKEQGNKDNFTEMIPLYTVSNKSSKEIGKGNFDKAIEKSQKAIKLHSIKRRPTWNKSRKKTERDIEWLSRREYNPFLWKAWMLMGRSQFHQGAFDEAASTFAYMSRLYRTQPAIYGKARAWLAKCYIEQDWLYDAEDVITKMKRDSLDWRAIKEWDYTYADYYIHTGRYAEAIPYLKKVIKHEMRRKQKARECYLLGQIYASLGQRDEAYKAFRRVIRMNPPYELEFNARISMTEVMAGGNAKQMISRLKRMARSGKNTEYLDQVYYAMGNIYLMQKDTLGAIGAYEKGNEKATRNGIEKGVLLLHLGDLYWAKEKFSDAKRSYGEAIGLLDKDRKDYKQLSERSKVLDELVPYTEAVHLQDSLQVLAKLPEKERNEAIDRVIEALKKKEKEERDRQAEADAQSQLAQQNAIGNRNNQNNTPTPTLSNRKDDTWYFYNPMTVNQGKQTFQRQWGKRENVDNWQRINKTVVAGASQMEQWTDEQRDSLAQAAAVEDSLKQITDSAQNDPHKREYYLKDIPFTEEQVEASNLIIMDGLHHSGVIFKDKLNNLRLGERQLRRLTDQYPSYEKMDDVYYHLYLLYMRKGEPQMADVWLSKLKADYPESQWTTLLTDPYFEENARFGTHMEDSLYAATYDAFKADRFVEVKSNAAFSEKRFPLGAHRDKFIFIGGLNKLNGGDSQGCLADMQTVVEKYPTSEVSQMAGMIINGVKAGRRLHGGKFDMGNVWDRRSYVLSDSDSIAARVFEPERDAKFILLIAYQPDSVNENQLLFEMARFNFTNFLVRNFDLTFEDVDDIRRLRLEGFRNYDEVLQYTRALYQQENITALLQKARIIIISDKNLELLGTQYSYEDYDKFYEEHFVPLKISTVRLLTEPATIEYEKKPEAPASEQQSNDGNGLYNGGVLNNETLIDLGIEQPEDNSTFDIPSEEPVTIPQQPEPQDTEIQQPEPPKIEPQQSEIQKPESSKTEPVTTPKTEATIPVQKPEPVDDGTIEIPAEVPATKPQTPVIESGTLEIPAAPTVPKPQAPTIDSGTIEIPAEPAPKPQAPVIESGTIEIPAATPATTAPTKPAATQKPVAKPKEKPVTKPKEQPAPKPKKQPAVEDTGIDFGDGFGSQNRPSTNKKEEPKKKKPVVDLEDEYYDLEGF